MAASVCLTCLWEEETGKTIDDSLSNVEWGRVIGVKEASVRRHRNHGEPKETAVPGVNGEETSFNSATGRKEFASIRSRPVTPEDAREWLRSSGDDPDEWHIAVRSLAYGDGKHSNKMSAWPEPAPAAIYTRADPLSLDGALPILLLGGDDPDALQRRLGDAEATRFNIDSRSRHRPAGLPSIICSAVMISNWFG